MRARQFRPTLGLLESRISLSATSGASMYQNWYEFTASDGPNPGDFNPGDPNYMTISENSNSATDGLNGVLLDSVID